MPSGRWSGMWRADMRGQRARKRRIGFIFTEWPCYLVDARDIKDVVARRIENNDVTNTAAQTISFSDSRRQKQYTI